MRLQLRSAQLFLTQRSMLELIWWIVRVTKGQRLHSIPHASSAGNGHGAGHQGLSVSPTSSTSPVNKESSLSHSEMAPKANDERAQDAPDCDAADVPMKDSTATSIVTEPEETV